MTTARKNLRSSWQERNKNQLKRNQQHIFGENIVCETTEMIFRRRIEQNVKERRKNGEKIKWYKNKENKRFYNGISFYIVEYFKHTGPKFQVCHHRNHKTTKQYQTEWEREKRRRNYEIKPELNIWMPFRLFQIYRIVSSIVWHLRLTSSICAFNIIIFFYIFFFFWRALQSATFLFLCWSVAGHWN